MSSQSINDLWRIASTLSLGWIRTRLRGNQSHVCLTFDDGPHAEHTPALLDLLKQYDARASFFVVGSNCAKNPDLIQRIRADGHAVGNHSMTHPIMRSLSINQQWRELAAMDRFLSDQYGMRHSSIRPPRGEVTLAISAYCLLHARQLVLWTQDSLDCKFNAEQVVQRFKENPITGGDRILFHDDARVAHDALTVLLPAWKRKGFRFETDIRKSVA